MHLSKSQRAQHRMEAEDPKKTRHLLQRASRSISVCKLGFHDDDESERTSRMHHPKTMKSCLLCATFCHRSPKNDWDTVGSVTHVFQKRHLQTCNMLMCSTWSKSKQTLARCCWLTADNSQYEENCQECARPWCWQCQTQSTPPLVANLKKT